MSGKGTTGSMQRIITPRDDYRELDAWIAEYGCKRIFLVCCGAFRQMEGLKRKLDRKETVVFRHYRPNPLYESVVEALQVYHENGCDSIIAVGGGSAMDVAKCVKLYNHMDPAKNYLKQEIIPNDIPFLAVPTTAGSGSEATRYAVVYYKGKKQSITSESCIPGTVLIDTEVLKTLPLYQRKSTMLDALSHAVESFWSVNSMEESKQYSREAIRLFRENMDGYLGNTEEGNAGMLRAAHRAGMAINISQTTAGHAMSYMMTSLFGCAHGHAAALCNRVLFPWMIRNTDQCIDPRGEVFLKQTFRELAEALGCRTEEEAAEKLDTVFIRLEMEIPAATEEQFKILRTSVNPVRLKNHPIRLDGETIDRLYRRILKQR